MDGMTTLPQRRSETVVGEIPNLPALTRASKKILGCCDLCEDRDEVRFADNVHYLQLEADNGSILTLCPACECDLLYVLLKNYVKRARRGKGSFVLLQENG